MKHLQNYRNMLVFTICALCTGWEWQHHSPEPSQIPLTNSHTTPLSIALVKTLKILEKLPLGKTQIKQLTCTHTQCQLSAKTTTPQAFEHSLNATAHYNCHTDTASTHHAPLAITCTQPLIAKT